MNYISTNTTYTLYLYYDINPATSFGYLSSRYQGVYKKTRQIPVAAPCKT
jgi:hypothetical protein